MDPAACLEILTRSAAEAQRTNCCAVGCPVPHQGGGEALVNALTGGGSDVESAPPLPPRGQVIDLETGENELSAEALLEKFPALRPGFDAGTDGSQAVPMEAETEVTAAAPLQPDGAADTVAMEGTSTATESSNVTAEEADRRLVERLVVNLRGTTPANLVKEVIRLHEQRVLVHKAYDGAFSHLLSAPGGGAEAVARMYPFVVGCATARFSVLSRCVRAAAAALEESSTAESGAAGAVVPESASIAEAAQLIRKLQNMEKERLQNVAAYHLEQSRLWAFGRVKENSSDSQMVRMARRTVADLRRGLGSTDEEIEETVSELKYCVAELQEATAI